MSQLGHYVADFIKAKVGTNSIRAAQAAQALFRDMEQWGVKPSKMDEISPQQGRHVRRGRFRFLQVRRRIRRDYVSWKTNSLKLTEAKRLGGFHILPASISPTRKHLISQRDTLVNH